MQFAGNEAAQAQASPEPPGLSEPTQPSVQGSPTVEPPSLPAAEPLSQVAEPPSQPAAPMPPAPHLPPAQPLPVPDALATPRPPPPPEPVPPATPEVAAVPTPAPRSSVEPPPPPPKPAAAASKSAPAPLKPAPPHPRLVSRPLPSSRLPIGAQTPNIQAPVTDPSPQVGGHAPAAANPLVPAAAFGPEVTAGWRGAVSAWLQSHKTYPDEARQRSEEGSALVRFTVDRSGRVLEFAVLRGTGSASLNAAVERMLTNAQLPAFPSTMTQERTTVTVQVRYALQ